MEKVEKLLLLVVLGAAMVIMAVMSFGSEDPDRQGNTNPQAGIPQAPSQGQAEPMGAQTKGLDSGKGSDQQSIDKLSFDVVDGPQPGQGQPAAGEAGSLAKGAKAAGNPQAGNGGPADPIPGDPKAGDFPNGSSGSDIAGGQTGPGEGAGGEGAGGQVSPLTPPTSAVITADVHLEPGDEPGIWIYTVQPKDSLSGIMEKVTGSTRNVAEVIAGWNEGLDRNRIRPGQKIQIPESMIKGSARPTATPRPSETTRHRLPVPGTIPAPVAVPVAADASRGGRQASPASTGTSIAPRTESYRIRKGETLWAIARRRVGDKRANAYVRRIQELNPGLDPSTLRPKDTIQLPAR